ncbi:MAG: hypothetical protein KAJ19_10495 [Gammaproteobacteria bacterium]|nr:hypothetical protein [Gammaproteobacteria bacterium]
MAVIKYRYKKAGGIKSGPVGIDAASKMMMESLSKEIKKIEGDIDDGMEAVAKFVMGKAQELTPVQFGILIGSAFSDFIRRGRKSIARVGYTALYAAAVHEMPRTTHFRKAGAENKFLEKAVLRNTRMILRLIKRHAKR